jgi:hypothetical protein
MAEHDNEAFSDEFDTARLDSIGPWTVEADEECLDIYWTRPPALQTGWVPFDLRFYIGIGGGSCVARPGRADVRVAGDVSGTPG